MNNVMSIDVEDWFCVYNLSRLIRYEDWDACESRVERSTLRLLELVSAASGRGDVLCPGLGGGPISRPREGNRARRARDRVAWVLPPAVDLHEARGVPGRSQPVARGPGEDGSAGRPRIPGAVLLADARDVVGRRHPARDWHSVRLVHLPDGIPPRLRHARRGPATASARRKAWSSCPWGSPSSSDGRFRAAAADISGCTPIGSPAGSCESVTSRGGPLCSICIRGSWIRSSPGCPGCSWASRFRQYNNLEKTEERLRRLLSEFSFTSARQLLADGQLSAT